MLKKYQIDIASMLNAIKVKCIEIDGVSVLHDPVDLLSVLNMTAGNYAE